MVARNILTFKPSNSDSMQTCLKQITPGLTVVSCYILNSTGTKQMYPLKTTSIKNILLRQSQKDFNILGSTFGGPGLTYGDYKN